MLSRIEEVQSEIDDLAAKAIGPELFEQLAHDSSALRDALGSHCSEILALDTILACSQRTRTDSVLEGQLCHMIGQQGTRTPLFLGPFF